MYGQNGRDGAHAVTPAVIWARSAAVGRQREKPLVVGGLAPKARPSRACATGSA